MYEIFHMVPGINPRPISALQLRCWAWYGSLGLIPGPIWKMSFNNLLLSHILLQYVHFCFKLFKIYSNMLKCVNLIEIRFYAYLYALSFLVLWHIIFETTAQIPGCNMLIFACPIIAKSQCWLFALRSNIRICPQISVFSLIYPYLPPYSTSGICAVVSTTYCNKICDNTY
jgi:hypothetical protein